MTLIEVLVAIGLLSVISMVLGNIILNQSTQMRRLYQRSDALEFKNSLHQVLNDPGKCSWQMLNKVLDMSAATPTNPSSTVLNLPILYEGPDATSSVLALADQPLLNNQTGIVFGEITAKNFIPTGSPDEYRGIVEVQLKEKNGVYVMKPAQGQVYVRTDPMSPLNAKRIIGCNSAAAPTSPVVNQAVYSTPDVLHTGTSWAEHGLTITVTPTKPAAQYLIHVVAVVGNGNWGGNCDVGLYKDSTPLVAPYASVDSGKFDAFPASFTFLDPSSSGTRTYHVQVRGSCSINRSPDSPHLFTGVSSITAIEY